MAVLLSFVSLTEYFDNLLFGGCAWVGKTAHVLHSIFRHHGKVLRLDPQLLQVGRNAQALAQPFDGGDAFLRCSGTGQIVSTYSHIQGNLLKAGHIADKVELHHIGQQHGVAHAMGKIVVAAQLVGHRVDIAQ